MPTQNNTGCLVLHTLQSNYSSNRFYLSHRAAHPVLEKLCLVLVTNLKAAACKSSELVPSESEIPQLGPLVCNKPLQLLKVVALLHCPALRVVRQLPPLRRMGMHEYLVVHIRYCHQCTNQGLLEKHVNVHRDQGLPSSTH